VPLSAYRTTPLLEFGNRKKIEAHTKNEGIPAYQAVVWKMNKRPTTYRQENSND